MPTNESSLNSDADNSVEQKTVESVGDILRAERIRLNLSEKNVADQLHITMHYVKAIESNSFEKLPGAVFAKGYIKSYALLLGLDESSVLSSYEGYVTELQDAAREKTRIQVRRRKDKNRPWVIGSGLGFVSLFVALWVMNSGPAEPQLADNNLSPETTSPEPVANAMPEAIDDARDAIVEAVDVESVQRETASSEPASLILPTDSLSQDSALAATTGIETAVEPQAVDSEELELPGGLSGSAVAELDSDSADDQPESVVQESDQRIQVESEGNDKLVITFSGESWIEVSDGFENQIYRDLREAGDVLEITGTAPFNILLGDAPFAQMILNGITIDVSDNIRIDNSARLTVGL